MRILQVLEKIFAVIVVAPPLYMAFRYMRWYLRQNKDEHQNEE